MASLFILIPIAMLVVLIAVAVFFWAVKNGQYDDLNAEGRRILFDDEEAGRTKTRVSSHPATDSTSDPSSVPSTVPSTVLSNKGPSKASSVNEKSEQNSTTPES